jgi:hypothetical protein
MESLKRSKAVIELGKLLVAQLKLGNDEVAQWMAHMLAERIHDAAYGEQSSSTKLLCRIGLSTMGA